MKTENTAVAVVRNKEGKILLVKRGGRTFHGYWSIPGGHAEKGETPEQTAQREANEEIGEVKIQGNPFMVFLHKWPADHSIKEPHQHKCHAFFGKVSGKLRAGDDAVELGWFTVEEAKKLKIVKYIRTVLDRLDSD
jgi:8-oxo-dGTP diphosphatase